MDEIQAPKVERPPDTMRLRDLIAQAERNAGSGRELAKILGVTPATLCRWKSSANAPRWDLFMLCAEVAEIDPRDVQLPIKGPLLIDVP